MNWALVKTFEGTKPLPEQLRDRYVKYWNRLWFGDAEQVIPTDGPYWEGPRTGRHVAGIVYELVSKYEVLHPEQPYELSVSPYTIRGRYALVRKRTAGGVPMVLDARVKEPKTGVGNKPDMRSLARWYHARMAHTYPEIGILHFPLIRGNLWTHQNIQERLVAGYLSSILKVADTGPRYPVPGLYCRHCTAPCLEVFHERPNDDRRI